MTELLDRDAAPGGPHGEELLALLELADEPLAVLTPDGEVRHANGAWRGRFGAGHLDDAIAPADRSAVRAVLAGLGGSKCSCARVGARGPAGEPPVEVRLRPAAGGVVHAAVVQAPAAGRGRDDAPRVEDLVDQLPDTAILTFDTHLCLRLVAGGAAARLGWQAEDLVGQRVGEPPTWDRPERLVPYCEAALAGRRSVFEHEFVADHRVALVEVAPLRGGDEVVGGVILLRDVTERRQADEALREADERFRNAFAHAPIGMALVSVQRQSAGRLLDVNAALARILWRSEEELRGARIDELAMPGDGAMADAHALRRLRTGAVDYYETERAYDRDGEALPVHVSMSLVRDGRGRPQYAIAQFQDITERKRVERDLEHLADHDSLTGMFNRRRFEAELDRHLALAGRHADPVAVMLLDIDHFKYVNDTLGHHAGDELIVRVAGLLRDRLRSTDVAARLGGDEFAVILPRTDGDGARTIAEQVVDAARTGSGQRRVTVSVGVALAAPGEPLSAEELLARADIAMYDAKEAGRDGFRLHGLAGERRDSVGRRMTWYDRLRRALDEDAFRLLGQPILELSSGRITNVELLLRLVDRDQLIAPHAFLPVAERLGLIEEIDRWVARRAIRIAEQLGHAGLRTGVEVNLSGRSMSDDVLLGLIEHDLARADVDPGRLTFEITETAAIVNLAKARTFAERLRARGCRFAIDDFGAGFGSFYYLKHLPFDVLKIDGEFIREVVSARADQLMVAGLAELARELGKTTVAEFVTDEQTLDWLRRHGIDFAQGFAVGEPCPLEQVWPRLAAPGPAT